MDAHCWALGEVVVPVAGLRAWVAGAGAEGCVVGASWERRARDGVRRPALRLVTVCAKGNGKRNGKGEEPTTGPPRITPLTANAYGGVKNYIKLIRQQEAAGRKSAPGARVSYRKTKKAQEQSPEETNGDVGDPLAKQRNLAALSGTLMNRKPPVLLVDGYNVLFKMADQNRKRFEQMDLEAQREALEHDVSMFSQLRGIRVMVVYDAAGSRADGDAIHREQRSGIDVVFCKTLEADIGLMVEATQSLLEGAPYVMIATSDRAAQVDCTGPHVHVVSSELLLGEIKDCKKRLRAKLRESQTQHARGRLGGAMACDSDLKKLRDQLSLP